MKKSPSVLVQKSSGLGRSPSRRPTQATWPPTGESSPLGSLSRARRTAGECPRLPAAIDAEPGCTPLGDLPAAPIALVFGAGNRIAGRELLPCRLYGLGLLRRQGLSARSLLHEFWGRPASWRSRDVRRRPSQAFHSVESEFLVHDGDSHA